MTMFLIVGTRLSTWQTARATNQRPSVKPLPTNRGVMPFHRSSQPFILQQCWEWSGAMLTDDAVICHSFFIWRIKIFWNSHIIQEQARRSQKLKYHQSLYSNYCICEGCKHINCNPPPKKKSSLVNMYSILCKYCILPQAVERRDLILISAASKHSVVWSNMQSLR